jgi:hypothetical protein
MLWLVLAHILRAQPHAAKVAAMTTDIIRVDDDTSREDLILALGYLNDTAKAIRRKGYTGTASDAYTRQHARIDALLGELVGH